MKGKGQWAILSLVFSLVLLNGCQKAAQDTNSAGPAANTNAAAETIDTAAIEAELTRIENDWPRVIKEKDVEAVKRVEADDGVFVYPDGSVGNKTTDVKDIENGALSADSWEVMDLKVTVLNKDAAVASGRSVVKNGKYKMPDGKSIDMSGQFHFIDTFVRRNGQWKLIAGATTKLREPEPAGSPSPAAKVSSAASPAPAASPAVKTPPLMTASPVVRPPLKKLPLPPVKPTP
jgi:hypothetical protein